MSEPALDLEQLFAHLNGDFAEVFKLIEIAEGEIAKAASENPENADILWHAYSLLRPTDGMEVVSEFVYRGHVREILARILAGEDTRPGTAAEICLLLADASAIVPLNTSAAGFYVRMWHAAFAGLVEWMPPNGDHYEALASDKIDKLEEDARRRIGGRESWRHMGDVTCDGQHHGEEAECRFHDPAEKTA